MWRHLWTCAAIALLCAISPATARAWMGHHSGGAGCGSTDPVPPLAASFGLTCEAFSDSLTSATTFDVMNTRAPGYNWYTNNRFTNAAINVFQSLGSTSPSDYSFSSSGVTTDIVSGAQYAGLMFSSCVQASNSRGYVGWTITAPFYFQSTFTWTGTTNEVSDWLTSVNMLTAGSGATVNYTEIDFFESIYEGAQQIQRPISGGAGGFRGWAYPALASGTLYTQGTMAITPAMNGGTGLYESSMNGSTAYMQTSYSPTIVPTNVGGSVSLDGYGSLQSGDLSDFVGQQSCVMISGGGAPNVATFKNIRIWCLNRGCIQTFSGP